VHRERRSDVAKKTFVIDMQKHYIPSEALQLVKKTSEYDFTIGLRRFTRAYEIMTDIDLHLGWMDAAGIDMAILSTAAFSANGSRFCRVCNDGYSKIIQKHPDRFRGVVHVYPFDKGKVRDEIKRGVEELGLWGIGVVSSYRNMTVDSPLMNPVYEMAMSYDMPVYVHPTIRTNLWGGDHYDLYMTVAREYDIAKSFVETIYGVLPRFPELKVIFAHFGGGLPALKGRLLAWHQPKDYPIPEEDRRHGMAIGQAKRLGLVDDFEKKLKNIYYDSAGFGGWLPVIKSAFEALGPDHICFGSDFPYELRGPRYVKKIIEDIKKIGVSRKDQEKFFSGNLKKLFKIV
jgi:predicted TIM-barrel fold metal-dependent hydrolase